VLFPISIGLTLAGTFLADSLVREIPARMAANGVPKQIVDQFAAASSGGQQLQLTGTGDLGAQILSEVPDQFKAFVQPFIDQIVKSIHEGFALSIASAFWIGIAAAILAAIFAFFLKEQPMTAMSSEPVAEAQPEVV